MKAGIDRLRVLIANERPDRLAPLVAVMGRLGHAAVTQDTDIDAVETLIARERPDIALVGPGRGPKHSLGVIDQIVRQAACPVIALVPEPDQEFVTAASQHGVFAAISDGTAEEWRSALDIALRRFAEYRDLDGAFRRRATIERAKGILMERHRIGEEQAFAMLRGQARNANRKLVDVAAAVVDGRSLLPGA